MDGTRSQGSCPDELLGSSGRRRCRPWQALRGSGGTASSSSAASPGGRSALLARVLQAGGAHPRGPCRDVRGHGGRCGPPDRSAPAVPRCLRWCLRPGDARRGVAARDALPSPSRAAPVARSLACAAGSASWPSIFPCVVFDQIDGPARARSRQRASTSRPGRQRLVGCSSEIRGLLEAPAEPVPCHGDGAVSNLMLRGDEVRLVGWTQTAAHGSAGGARLRAHGVRPLRRGCGRGLRGERWASRRPARLARAHLYGVADDVRWGLIGSIARAEDPDSPVEYQRYGHWRLFKARFAVTEGRVERWMKEAS